MALVADGFYSFENLDGGGYEGLVRIRDGVADLVSNGAWVNHQDVLRHFVDPGSTFLEPVDEATAQQLANRYGVSL
jgi:hypothetical protein